MAIEYQHVFAALDGGMTQEDVARKAAAIAAVNRAHLMFGTVIDSLPPELAEEDTEAVCEQTKRRISAMIEPIITDINEKVEAGKIASFEFKAMPGNVNTILHRGMILPFGADLVICGERGLSTVKYAFVGSTSTYLIRNLRCDVLVVKKD